MKRRIRQEFSQLADMPPTPCPVCGSFNDQEHTEECSWSCLFQARFQLQRDVPEARFFRCCGTLCHFQEVCAMLKKPVKSTPSSGYCVELQVECPTVADFLCQDQWEDEDGKMVRRETGSIVLFVQDGRLKCSVNDPAMQRVAFLTLDGPDTFWTQLEAHLAKDDLDWRNKVKDKWRK